VLGTMSVVRFGGGGLVGAVSLESRDYGVTLVWVGWRMNVLNDEDMVGEMEAVTHR
jgi:hypothetical protein